MTENYRCYFIGRDGTNRSLASVEAHDAFEAVELITRQFPKIPYRVIEVWRGADRVLTWKHPATTTLRRA